VRWLMAAHGAFRPLMGPRRTAPNHPLFGRSPRGEITAAGDLCTGYSVADHTVVPATLTGLGERAHLLNPDISLETHVADIVGLFHYRDLHQVILVGHSYGGTVITAVAERVPDRIHRLVRTHYGRRSSAPQDNIANQLNAQELGRLGGGPPPGRGVRMVGATASRARAGAAATGTP
jgi:pimeloyl-ACP methyl ester carboxylesterase